jgi:hypothetical protein
MAGYRTDVSSKSNVVSFPVPRPNIAPTIYFERASCTYRSHFSSLLTPHIGDASPPQEVLSHSPPTQSPRSHRRPFKADPIVTDDTSLILGTRHPTPHYLITKWPEH